LQRPPTGAISQVTREGRSDLGSASPT